MRLRDKILVGLLATGLAITAAYAQWQVGDHAIPIGNGAGVTGFNSAVPGAAGIPLISNGVAVDPSFGTVVVAGGGTGLTTLTANAILFGNGTGTIGTNRCTMDANQSVACASGTSTAPINSITNITADVNGANFWFQKNRAGGVTNTSDNFGILQWRGFANGAQQAGAQLSVSQTAAATGSNIPSVANLFLSSSTGVLNKLWSFDGQTVQMGLPAGGSTIYNGGSSGFGQVIPQAAAGSAVLTLPNTTGTFAISAGASSPLSVNTTTGAIGFSGMSSDGILVASSATSVVTNRCSMSATADIVCSTSTSFLPQMAMVNTTNDAQGPYYMLKKNRAGGVTSASDNIGNIMFQGFANGAQQNTTDIIATQTGAASGSTIPSNIALRPSSVASGQLGVPFTFDGTNRAFSLPTGGTISLPGSASGAAAISVPAAAGTPATLQLPTVSGSAGNFLSTNGSGVLSWAAATGVTPDFQVFTTPGANTWTRPSGVTVVRVIVCGAGGGGGGGARVAANTAASGGAGGGGGYCNIAVYKAADAGASQTVTVATGAAGGTGATVNGNPGNTGTNAGNTTFGTLLTGFGGGGGQGGLASTAGSGGGGGGGPNVAGALGVNTSVAFATSTSELAPFYTTSNTTFAFPCMGTIGSVVQLVTAGQPPPLACPNGGGGGGGSPALASPAGGWPGQDAGFHGPGGGGGGGINNTNNFSNGSAGGRSIGCPVGGAAGATSNGGSTAPDFNYHPGCGGGSGAGAGTFSGGAGTNAGGGGGGGVGSAVNGGTGGTGGNGFAVVISW